VTILEGPRFEPRDPNAWAEWDIQEVLRFIANDPLYFDPDEKSVNFGQLVCAGFTYTFPFNFCDPPQLVFPFIFPIVQFNDWEAHAVVDYQGTWIEYPNFLLTGRMTGVVIENQSLGHKIDLRGFMLAEGETAIIDLAYGSKIAHKNDGTNLIPYLTSDSDINDFHLRMGENEFNARVTFPGEQTNVEMFWHERFIGI